MSELHPEKSCCTTVGRGFDSPHLHHSPVLQREIPIRARHGYRMGTVGAAAEHDECARAAGVAGFAGALSCRLVIAVVVQRRPSPVVVRSGVQDKSGGVWAERSRRGL